MKFQESYYHLTDYLDSTLQLHPISEGPLYYFILEILEREVKKRSAI